ncbi:hypothetical protein QLX08_009283 [Tetragonisca angustula]|uniref:SCP domain-containing protein n=1 Tax=Tetragonisca angustula TaxID=166442 RepID=A0AAW0ZH96_9HYME
MESSPLDPTARSSQIVRNYPRCPASRRLLANGDPRKDTIAIATIHTSNANWPPSTKREEAKALENLRKRVQQSKLYKADPTCRSSFLFDNDRPNLLKKILGNRPMTVARDANDFETDWRDSEFITESLCWHNVYRQRHDAPPLTMSPQLCEYAQTWANHLAHANTFYYRNDREVGQNLYCRPGSAVPTDVTGQDVASYWYSAVEQYDFFKEPDILHANVNAGHFTQLIWASSRYFGVGKARSRSGKVIVVANYQPVGNVSGQFQTNVLPPLPENVNVALSSQRQPSVKVFRRRCVASSALPLSDAPSTDSDRSSVGSTR